MIDRRHLCCDPLKSSAGLFHFCDYSYHTFVIEGALRHEAD